MATPCVEFLAQSESCGWTSVGGEGGCVVDVNGIAGFSRSLDVSGGGLMTGITVAGVAVVGITVAALGGGGAVALETGLV